MTVDGALHPIDQVTKQLHKLVNVIKIRDMEPEQTIAREMAVFKVQATVESRGEIMQFAEIFRADVIDVSRRTLTIEVTGDTGKIDAFERMAAARARRDGAHRRGRDQPLAPGGVTAGPAVRAATEALEAIQDGIEQAVERDRRTLASATVEVADLDPAALGFASRLASDRWFCWEQPERDGFALAGIGTAWDAISRGEARFADVERACAELARDRVAAEPRGCPPAPGRCGPEVSRSRPTGAAPWSSLPPALAVLPELALCRVEGSCT